MLSKSLLIFLASALSLISLSSASGRDRINNADIAFIQDSVKRVSIKVTVSEKQEALDFDKVIESADAEEKLIKSRRKFTNRKPVASSVEKPVIANNVQKPAAAAPKPSENTVITIAKPQPKQEASSTTPQPAADKQTPSTKKIEDDHQHSDEVDRAVIEDQSPVTETDIKVSRTYLWVGFMLVVVGAILAILFGKTALLITIAGMVFVIIGYTIK